MQSFLARRGRSGREESSWGGEGRPKLAPAVALLRLGSTRARGRRRGGEMDEASRADKDDAVRRARFAGARDTWRSPVVCRSPAWARVRAQCSTGRRTVIDFDRFLTRFDPIKLKISYRNLKFGQNKSCRGRKDLQLLFWTKVDLRPRSERKTWSNSANLMFTMQLD